MRMILRALIAASAAIPAATALGHGEPIVVKVDVGNRLEVSNGLPVLDGYVDQAFDYHVDNYFSDDFPGGLLATQLPGFNFNLTEGPAVGSVVQLEVIARPDFSRPARPSRWLWHWSDATGEVAIADAGVLGDATDDPFLRIRSQRGFGTIELNQAAPPSPGAVVKLAETLDSDGGTHEHMALYLLDNVPAAPTGVYGFFARLTSPSYLPSEPFLIALNYTDSGSFATASTHINIAAGLASDFNVDGKVDGGDLLVWQRTLGTIGAPGVFPAADGSLDGAVNAADLAVWRNEYGRVVMYPPAPSSAAGTSVPEPASAALSSTLALAWTIASGASRRLAQQKPGPRGQG